MLNLKPPRHTSTLREAVIDCAWATETPERSRAPRTLTLSIAPHRRKNLVPIRIEHAPNITYSHTAPTRSVIGFEAEGCRAKIFRTAARPTQMFRAIIIAGTIGK